MCIALFNYCVNTQHEAVRLSNLKGDKYTLLPSGNSRMLCVPPQYNIRHESENKSIIVKKVSLYIQENSVFHVLWPVTTHTKHIYFLDKPFSTVA